MRQEYPRSTSTRAELQAGFDAAQEEARKLPRNAMSDAESVAGCRDMAPTRSVRSSCCANPVRARLHIGLLTVLRRIATQPLSELLALGAVANAVREVGIQPALHKVRTHDASVGAGRGEFGAESAYFLNYSMAWAPGVGVHIDPFGLPAMGLWQVPAQFECLIGRLAPLLRRRRIRRGRTATVGTWSGWTDLVLSAYIRRLGDGSSRHTTFDIHNFLSDCTLSLFEAHGVVRARHGWYGGNESWTALGLAAEWDGRYPAAWAAPVLDFCFIDGGHSYYLANRDFRTMRSGCSALAFHDIVNHRVGLSEQPRLWRDLTTRANAAYAAEFHAANCTQQPMPRGQNMGIGLLSRRNDS